MATRGNKYDPTDPRTAFTRPPTATATATARTRELSSSSDEIPASRLSDKALRHLASIRETWIAERRSWCRRILGYDDPNYGRTGPIDGDPERGSAPGGSGIDRWRRIAVRAIREGIDPRDWIRVFFRLAPPSGSSVRSAPPRPSSLPTDEQVRAYRAYADRREDLIETDLLAGLQRISASYRCKARVLPGGAIDPYGLALCVGESRDSGESPVVVLIFLLLLDADARYRGTPPVRPELLARVTASARAAWLADAAVWTRIVRRRFPAGGSPEHRLVAGLPEDLAPSDSLSPTPLLSWFFHGEVVS